jgi:hypothetical protein
VKPFSLALLLFAAPALAQQATTVQTCGSPPHPFTPGATAFETVDVNGRTCGLVAPTASGSLSAPEASETPEERRP